ncbi:transporter substrate-binding domain-containing protein [Aquincola sp. S2]|uniref:Transporter substrate-binding domain-containing protein n=1 Tax=Pseudaquabacterium terrae TaxID=2732868 RepID=A0ABX2EE63_9BURK|nr:transporter substrate-binding domain-containing protein [Aquabacterium terrae]NRF66906.1 transporter substrate-binding domain-containing protein [Aquabacterium terrae]
MQYPPLPGAAAAGLVLMATAQVPVATAQVPVATAQVPMAAAQAQPAVQAPITLHYQERPPYSYTAADGQPQGLLVAPAVRALQRAQLPFQWVKTPSQRQLVLIQGSAPTLDCGLGWFRNPEREQLGRFSLPLYQDRPFMALARRDGGWSGARAPAELLADAALPLLVKEGYSYGPLLDGAIAQHPASVRRTSAESAQMARMVEAGRAAWMIIAPEEGEALLSELGTVGAQLQLLTLAGVPDGQQRHLYCNRAVPDAVVERLNRALAER